MSLKQKKICILFCAEPEILDLKNVDQKSFNKWTKDFIELSILADIKPIFIWQGNGLDSSWQVWQQLAREIYKHHSKYDGFVIMHSVDNILYASSLLTYMLSGILKPVVFTFGVPDTEFYKSKIFKKESIFFNDFSAYSFKASFINAIQTACLNLKGINILDGNNLIPASRACKSYSFDKNVYKDSGYNTKNNINKKQKLILKDKIEPRLKIIEFYPTQEKESLDLKNRGILVIKSGYVNTWPQVYIKEIKKLDIPIMIYGLLDEITVNSLAKIENIIVANNITYESAVAKFVWAAGQSNNIGKIKKLFNTNISGEFI